jgi:hypothetical protein
MKSILIDPWKKSLETIELPEGYDFPALQALYNLVGEEGIDAASIIPGELIIVGDYAALHDPPLPSYTLEGYKWPLYGRGVVIGYRPNGEERETKLTVDDLSQIISWCS